MVPGGLLSGELRASYDRVAAAYAAHVGGELAGKPADRQLLDELAARVRGIGRSGFAGPPAAVSTGTGGGTVPPGRRAPAGPSELPGGVAASRQVGVAGGGAGGGLVGDLGCGPGHVAAYLADRGVRVVGVDLSPGMLAQAPAGLPVVAGDLRALPLRDGTLSAAVAFYSLIHLPPRTEVAALAEIRRVLAPGGVLLAAVHVGSEVRHLDEWWGVPVSVDFRFFEVAELTGWLERAGLEVEDMVEREHYPDVEVATRRVYVRAVNAGSRGTRRGSGRP